MTPIGVVQGPYETPADAPHQGFADDAEATLEVFGAYADGLSGIEDVVPLTVVYWPHRPGRDQLVAADSEQPPPI